MESFKCRRCGRKIKGGFINQACPRCGFEGKGLDDKEEYKIKFSSKLRVIE